MPQKLLHTKNGKTLKKRLNSAANGFVFSKHPQVHVKDEDLSLDNCYSMKFGESLALAKFGFEPKCDIQESGGERLLQTSAIRLY